MNNVPSFVEFIKKIDKTAYKLPLYLGIDKNESPVVVDFPKIGSILMLGTKGTGKTTFAHSTICSLLSSFPSSYLEFILIDLKEPEFSKYENLPSVMGNPIYNSAEAIRTLSSLSNTPGSKYQIIMIDTFSDLVINYGIILSRIIKNLTSRKNTYVIMWDSKPYEEIFSPDIKDCFSSKIIFNLDNKKDADVILNQSVDQIPEKKGEAMIFCKHNSDPVFVRCPHLSESEIEEVVNNFR